MDSESRSSIVSPSTLCSFFTLAVIRGTFAVTVHFGIAAYQAPSLLFLLRTPGTVGLFVISVLYLASKEEEVQVEIVNDLKNFRSYTRAALMGFTQLCGPYLLFMYAMKYFSPTLGGVFMAATPWTTALLDQILVVTVQTVTIGRKNWSAIGSLVGVIGVVTVSVANICMVTLDISCKAKYGNLTENGTDQNGTDQNGSIETNGTKEVLLKPDTCESTLRITTAFLALCGATLLWSVSAAFSRLRRINLHFLSGGLLNNIFAGIYAAILWVLLDPHLSTKNVKWDSVSGSMSVIFLTLASSWVAAVVLYQLVRKIGAESTNRVMCLVPMITWVEDQLMVRNHTHLQLWIIILEAIGTLFVVIGLYLSSFPKSNLSRIRADGLLLPEQYTSEEEDNGVFQRVNELSEYVQSEEELEVSGASSLQESADPPMIHYADDEHDEEEHLW